MTGMNKIIILAMLVGGAALVVYGIGASESLASGFSRLFTGAPTDKAIWMLIAGCVLVLLGLGGFLRGPRTSACAARRPPRP